jgi:hypothetical protein
MRLVDDCRRPSLESSGVLREWLAKTLRAQTLMAGESTMKRATILAMVYAHLVLFWSHACSGAPPKPGSPEAVVSKAMNAVNHGRIDEFVSAIDPDSLEEFRTAVVETIDEAAKRVGEAKLLESFPGVKSVKGLKALDAPRLFAGVIRRKASDPSMKKSLANTQIDVFGHITEGEDTAHVVYRSKMKLGESDIVRMNVATLRKNGQTSKMVIPEEFAGPTKQAGPGLPKIDFTARRVEPLGHLLDGQGAALIIYRMSIPVGDSSISKLAVMDLSPRDPAFEAVRTDKLAEVKKLLEERLGLSSTTAPTTSKTARQKSSTVRPKTVAKAMPRSTRASAKANTRKTRPSDSTTSELPEGLIDLPATFRGGDRDRFHDIGPEGAVLVGARVSYIMRFGGPKISSIKPIYRVGEKLVDGERRGGLLGKETTAVAKPGYAVGAINTHTGLTVDGFEMVFMRIDGDRLDSGDSYNSPWLGDEKGGNPRDVSSEGKIPLGLQGRAGKEVYALGLIVEK